MARTAETRDVPPPRIRSREEMDAIYRQIVARDPKEGPALVETHKRLIATLDDMIVKRRRKRRGR